MSNHQKTGTRRVSMCISVRGALAELHRSRKKGSYWTDDNGKALSREQAIDALCDDLAAGRETLPLGKECANPCPHADKGCKGFDFRKDGGCPGYWIAPETPP